MEKNKTKHSIFDAMKIYNGCNPVIQAISLWSIATLIFLLIYIVLRFVLGSTIGEIDQVDGEVINGVSRTTFTMFMTFTGIIVNFMFQIQEFYKESAGGKYFRSVCGGFDTYSRMKTGQMLQCICGHVLFVVLVFLADTVFNLVSSCLGVCATVFLVSLSGTAVVRLLCMIKSQAVKSLVFCGYMGLHAFLCACIVGVTDGQISSVHIVLLILAVIMITFAHFTDLKNYRKKHWYN